MAYKYSLHQTDELESLIRECAQNKRGAQNKLYELCYPRMMAMVRRYFPDTDIAEEVLNNGFLRVFQNIGSYRFEGSFEGWMRRIFTHAIIKYFHEQVEGKDEIQISALDPRGLQEDTSEYFVDRSFVNNLKYKDLLGLVQELPPIHRTVFNLFVIDGYSHKEISKDLGLKGATSRWYLSEARRILKRKIDRYRI